MAMQLGACDCCGQMRMCASVEVATCVRRRLCEGCLTQGPPGEFNPSVSVSSSHQVPGTNRYEVLITHIGNKIIDVVALPVDEDGMPT